MLDLSPTKLLIIFVVVVVLLGPKRLPEVARQLGAGWRKVRELHLRFDRELRESLPDLPSSRDIVRFARSPVTLLDQLADRHDSSPAGGEADGPAAAGSRSPAEASGAADAYAPSRLTVPAAAAFPLRGADTDDPNLN